jgi:hypothetical protein
MQYLGTLHGCYVRTLQIGIIPGRANLSQGMPDLIVCWQGDVFWIEVKTKSGRVTPKQQAFLDMWRLAGGKAIVARSWEEVRDYCTSLEVARRNRAAYKTTPVPLGTAQVVFEHQGPACAPDLERSTREPRQTDLEEFLVPAPQAKGSPKE